MDLIIRGFVCELGTQNMTSHVIWYGPVNLMGRLRTFRFYISFLTEVKLGIVTLSHDDPTKMK